MVQRSLCVGKASRWSMIRRYVWAFGVGLLAALSDAGVSRAACSDFGLADGSEIVEFETTRGSICLELLRSEAPLTVQNFLRYVEDGDYDGTVIHRSVPGFVIQGGGFAPVGSELQAIPADPPVQNEPCEATSFDTATWRFICPERGNEAGTVAMAKLGDDPDSATSQWFFNLADNRPNLDTGSQSGGFTVFARVLGDTFAVVQDIAALPLAAQSAGFFLGPANGSAFGSLPLLSPVQALDAAFGCWDPGDLSVIITATPAGFKLVADPETTGLFLLSNDCGTQIPFGTFVADPGSGACPGSDILGAALADPILDLVPRPDPSTSVTDDFVQFEFTCEQQQEALTQRALWRADLWNRASAQLVMLERASVRTVPEPDAAAAGVAVLTALAAVSRCGPRRSTCSSPPTGRGRRRGTP